MNDDPTSEAGGVLQVAAFAELTAHNSEQFRQQIRAALNGQTSIEIDLSRTTFMDCAGLGALIALRHHARSRNGVMRLVHPTPAVRQLFDLMRADEVFEIVSPAGVSPHGARSIRRVASFS
jgi:anti-anti-sigma factor